MTHKFILNGLKHANALMGDRTDGVTVKQGERIRIEESYKYSHKEAKKLWELARLSESAVWANSMGDYGQYESGKTTQEPKSDCC